MSNHRGAHHDALPQHLAALVLYGWYQWRIRSRSQPTAEPARMLRQHGDGVLRPFICGLTNGLLKNPTVLVQAAKATARGCQSPENLKLIVNMLAGHVGLLPT
jgi:transposase